MLTERKQPVAKQVPRDVHVQCAVLYVTSAVHIIIYKMWGKRERPRVHGIFQARVLEWVAMPSSKGSSQPWDQTCISCVSCIAGELFTC